ncbi:ferritin-like domain-containing protein [Paraliomyxa miuraensis]|uniref:ferritin-like domain-containing protein n=1 Tax=Paraliomyxa miuraensis TaxID=376150 RepID=UPI002254B32C|nr:ferritin-like domain-containing protein [Paraliomyxa miuraensis]MCX4246223.1 ferritin-like domain-containing protein [Paraliomyxa miuraensis]
MVRVHGSLMSIFSVVLAGCPCIGFDDTPYERTEDFTATEEEAEPFEGPDGELLPDACEELCIAEFGTSHIDGPQDLQSCELVSYDPQYTEAYLFECTFVVSPQCIGGRRPAGLASSGTSEGAEPIGRWLAETAHLEAASVPAFDRLAARLSALGAPAALVAAARDAARDEVEHARVMTARARAHGAEPAAVRVDPMPEPDLEHARERELEALAVDNAVEGCVRETWAALVAWVQAEHAEDLALREVFVGIARDETRHAELARSVSTWLEPRLSPRARARVRAARDRAVAELRRTAGRGLPEASRQHLGLPSRAMALALLDGLQPRLWAA